MSRAPLVRALIALGIVAGSAYITVTTPARLGLDLRGGTQIVLETQDSPTVKAGKESTDRAVEVLRRRVDALGVAEPTLTRSGDRRIIVELPGLQDPREAADVIGRTAQLSFHPVVGTPPPTPAGDTPTPAPAAADGEQVLPDEDGQPVRIGPSALTGDGVDGAEAELDPQGLSRWSVTVDFKGSGGSAWQRADRGGGMCRAQRPDPPGGDRPGRPGDLVAAGRPVGAVRRRHRRRLDPDHRLVHREGSEGPRSPDPGRCAARARRGDRAADRRRHARCSSHRGQCPGGGDRRPADRAVHHRRLPAARRPGGGRARQLRPAVLRDAGHPGGHAHLARAGRLRAGHRDGDRRERPGVRTGQGGVRRGWPHQPAIGGDHRFRQGLERHHRLQRDHPARGWAVVLPGLGAGAGLRGHPRDRRAGLDGLGAC